MWKDVNVIQSAESSVKKLVFTGATAIAEAVLYKYPDYKTRTVICCSTQSGCPVGCRFCGAGDYFVRNLTWPEIASQVDRALLQAEDDDGTPSAEIERLQIMFMAMGEPMLNQKGMLAALGELNDRYPQAALLVSTSGPSVNYHQLLDMAQRIDKIGLQFSVHESTDEARDKLIPFKQKLNLAAMATMGEYFLDVTGRRPFFNYCAHDGNVTMDDAYRLAGLFKPSVWEATISVVCERNEGLPARNDHQVHLARSFAQALMSVGYNTRVFDPAGQDDIGGGCGQLWFVQKWMLDNPELAAPSIGHPLPKIHTPAPLPPQQDARPREGH